MKLNKINSFNEFKIIKNDFDLLFEADGYNTLANTTKFSDSLIGRGAISLLKFFKRGADLLKLEMYKRKYDSELAMGILRAYKELEKSESVQDIQSQEYQSQVKSQDDNSQVKSQDDNSQVKSQDGQNQDVKKQSQDQNQKQPQKIEFDKKEYIKNSKIFLNSILEISMMIEKNSVRFKGEGEFGESYGKLLNKLTYFDFEKYQNMKNIYKKDKSNTKILQNLLSILKNGLESALSNNNKNEINLFNQELKLYGDKYWKMVMDNVNKNKKETFTEISKDIINKVKTDSSSIDDIKELLKNQKVNNKYRELISKWVANQKKNNDNTKPGEGTRKRIMKDTLKSLGMLSENLLLEEVESNVQSNENHSKNAWNKVIKAYKQSNIKNYLNDIKNLLNTDLSKGKDEYKNSINNIVLITKQVVKNISISGPISFDNLIKENLYNNDIPKSISLFSKVLLSFKEDMGLLGTYGSATNPMKNFINSFYNIQSMLTKSNENYNFNYQMINEEYKKIYGDDTKLDWSYFKDSQKSQKMLSAFKDISSTLNVKIDGKEKNIFKGEYLKRKATELTNKEAIAAIQYAIQSSIFHTDTPSSNKLFPGGGGGINQKETYLARVWKKMINNVKSKYQPYLDTSKLDPYKLTESIKDTNSDKLETFINDKTKEMTILKYLYEKSNKKYDEQKTNKFIIMSSDTFYFLKKDQDDNIKVYSNFFTFKWDENKKDGYFVEEELFNNNFKDNPLITLDNELSKLNNIKSLYLIKQTTSLPIKQPISIINSFFVKNGDNILKVKVKLIDGNETIVEKIFGSF